MFRDAAVAEIQEGLGFRTDLTEAIIRRMQRVQFLLQQGKTLPWFLLQENSTISVSAGGDATIPADFLREFSYGHGLFYRDTSDSSAVFLRKMTLDEAEALYGTEDNDGFPAAYVVRKSTFRLFPRPANALTLYWDYFKKAAELTSNIENEWLLYAPYLIIGNAGASMAQTLRNEGAVSEFTSIALAAQDALNKENALREITNRTFILGRNS